MCFWDIAGAALFSFCASAGCCFYLNTNLRHIPLGGTLGAVGWIIYKIVLHFAGNLALSYVLGAFGVALLAEILASVIHAPATVFLVPGLLPLVPGGGIFSMMRYAVLQDFALAKKTGYETAVAALGIALGIAVAASMGQIIRAFMFKINSKK